MREKFRGRDFLSLMDFTRDEILDILKVSYYLKK
jgi:ornithine carbamoyltransferase